MKKKSLILLAILAFTFIGFTTNVSAAAEHQNTESSFVQDEKEFSENRQGTMDTEKEKARVEDLHISCKNGDVAKAISFTKNIYNIMRVAVPVILVIMGSLDFAKATIASNTDEMEKNKKRFINRLIIAAAIFLLLSLFQLITNILVSSGVAGSDSWLTCWDKA